MTDPQAVVAAARAGNLYFWNLKQVMERVTLSKSEIYRRIRDTDPDSNPFPPSRHFQNDEKKGVFWLSTEVTTWQLRELGLAPAAPSAPDVAGLLG